MSSSDLDKVLYVGLLYEQAPSINQDDLLNLLAQRAGFTETLRNDPGQLQMVFPETPEERGRNFPARLMIFLNSVSDGLEKLTPALNKAVSQTWDWNDASRQVAACKHIIIISDFKADRLDHKKRVASFHEAVRAVCSLAACRAMWWRNSERIANPEWYLKSKEANPPDWLYSIANIRMFSVRSDTEGEKVMDTLGLVPLGLPDLQIRFSNLHPDQVAKHLGRSARVIFEQGDIVKDGETIPGIEPDQWWRCRHETSLVEPKRLVMDINPGEPYAADKR